MPPRLRRTLTRSGVVGFFVALSLTAGSATAAVLPTTPIVDPAGDALADVTNDVPDPAGSTGCHVSPTTPGNVYDSNYTLWRHCREVQRMRWEQSVIETKKDAKADLLSARVGLTADRLLSLVETNQDGFAELESVLEDPQPVVLSQGTVEDLAFALSAAMDGGSASDDPLADPRFRMLFGLMVGLWVMTRIFRMVIPGG